MSKKNCHICVFNDGGICRDDNMKPAANCLFVFKYNSDRCGFQVGSWQHRKKYLTRIESQDKRIAELTKHCIEQKNEYEKTISSMSEEIHACSCCGYVGDIDGGEEDCCNGCGETYTLDFTIEDNAGRERCPHCGESDYSCTCPNCGAVDEFGAWDGDVRRRGEQDKDGKDIPDYNGPESVKLVKEYLYKAGYHVLEYYQPDLQKAKGRIAELEAELKKNSDERLSALKLGLLEDDIERLEKALELGRWIVGQGRVFDEAFSLLVEAHAAATGEEEHVMRDAYYGKAIDVVLKQMESEESK